MILHLLAIVLLSQSGLKPERLPVEPISHNEHDDVVTDTIKQGVSKVEFGADTVIYFTDTRSVLLLGNGWVSYGDITVLSDSIKFSTGERLLSAYKGACLKSGKDTLSGLSLDYSVKSSKGVMRSGRTQIEQGYFYGEGVWLVEKDILYITKGYYTTCDKDPPHYDFYGRRLKVIVNDMVIAKPIFLRFGKIPVLGAPFWYMPIGTKRKSGLMPFKLGYSTGEGWFIKQARYYWAINDYSQALFSLDIMTRRGFRPGISLDWLYGPRGAEYIKGGFHGDYANERDTRNQRWNLSLNNSSKLVDGTGITADLNFTSDVNYISDYIEDPDSVNKVIDPRTKSYISVRRKIFTRRASLNAFRSDNLSTGYYSMTLPEFSFSWPMLNLWDVFSVNFSSFKASNKYVHNVDTVTNNTSDIRTLAFSQPVSMTWRYVFKNAYSFSQTWTANQNLKWQLDSTGRDTLIRGGAYSLSNRFSTTFYRIFGVYGLGMNGVLHTIQPSVSYVIVPATQVIYPWLAYPRLDTTLVSHGIAFNISQTFVTKLKRRDDSTAFRKQELFSLSTSLSYNILTDSISPISARLNFPSGLPLQASLSGGYNIYTDSVTLSSNASLQIHELIFPILGWDKLEVTSSVSTSLQDTSFVVGDSLELVQNCDSCSNEPKETFKQRFAKSKLVIGDNWTLNGAHMLFLNTDLYLPLDIKLQLGIDANFSKPQSVWKEYITNYHLTLGKGLHCWELLFEVRPDRGNRLSLDNLKWDIYVRIKELPDIQIGKGIFSNFGIASH